MTRTLTALSLLLLLGLAPAALAQSDSESTVECSDEQNTKAQYYSLYYEAYKAEDYATALPNLEWILECDPTFGLTPGDRNIRRGIDVFEALAVAAEDEAEREAYFGRALVLLDEGPSILQDAGVETNEYDWVIKKGRFIQGQPELLSDEQPQVYDLYVRAFEIEPDSLSDYYINYLGGESSRRANEEDTPEAKGAARDFITDELMPYVDDPAYLEGVLETLITTPREQYSFLVKKFREDASTLGDEDLSTLYEMNKIPELAETNPDLNDLIVEELLKRDPNPALLLSLGGAAASKGNYDDAQGFYERAMEMAEDPMKKRDINYSLAVMKQQQGQRATAVNYARAALELDSNHAESMYLIGTLIQQSVGRGDARAAAGFWCAADQFSRAASAAASNGNSTLAADARRAAANAASGGPSTEDYFFLGWQPGQTITASYGWGSCSTRVR